MGIYWNHHHHMLHAVKQVNGAILWANLNLLFWMSLLHVAVGNDRRIEKKLAGEQFLLLLF